jgi:hypothetical protein
MVFIAPSVFIWLLDLCQDLLSGLLESPKGFGEGWDF